MRSKTKYMIITFIIASTLFVLNSTVSRYQSSFDSTDAVDIAVPQISLVASTDTRN